MPLEPYRKPLSAKQQRKQDEQVLADLLKRLTTAAKEAHRRTPREPDTWLEERKGYDHQNPKFKRPQEGWTFRTTDLGDSITRYFFNKNGEIFCSHDYIDTVRQAAKVHSINSWKNPDTFRELLNALAKYSNGS